MTDDLILQAREMQKRMIATTLPGELADALEAQARRIGELRKEADMMHSEYKTARARIAELTAALNGMSEVFVEEMLGAGWIMRDIKKVPALRAARAAYLGEKE